MTFTFQNKPDAPDLLSVSQVDLKNNAQYFQAALNKDHQIVFGDTNVTTFEGRHRQVSLSSQALPGPALPNDGIAGIVYCSSTSLFWKSNGGTNNIEIAGPNTVLGNPVTFTPGSVFLGGLTLNFGAVQVAANTTQLINYQTPFTLTKPVVTLAQQFPVVTVLSFIQIVGTPDLLSFSVHNLSASPCVVHYMAIGR